MDSEASTSAYELENITRLGRRPSAGAASQPFGGRFAMTAMTTDSAVEDDDATLTEITAETSTVDATMTQVARRASRGADGGFKPLATLSPMAMGEWPVTPPDTPSKIHMPAQDPFAPTLAVSLPPTPGEAPDPFGSDTEHEAGADEAETEMYALPPVDRGVQAWGFLVSATCIEAVIWGLPYSVGVLHEYWVSTLFGPEATSTLTLASTLQTGLLFFSGALLGP